MNNEQSRVTSFLPTSNPSPKSGRLDHPRDHQERARTSQGFPHNTWKPPDQSSLHNVPEQAPFIRTVQTLFFLQKTKFRMPPNRSKGPRGSFRGPSGAQQRKLRQRQDSVNGGAERDRTADPLLAKQVLSQLSYSPIQLDHRRSVNLQLGNIFHTNQSPAQRPAPQFTYANGGPG